MDVERNGSQPSGVLLRKRSLIKNILGKHEWSEWVERHRTRRDRESHG